MSVLVVGAGLAGVRAAETLRALGYQGLLTIVGEEDVAPYERPALSKEFLAGTRPADSLQLRPDSFWAEQGIELRLGERVRAVDFHQRRATSSRGELAFEQLIVATGARARQLPGPQPAGVHSLRTLADASRLREGLADCRRLAVVGGGFVGAEVASTALALGIEVSVIEAQAQPMVRPLGTAVGRLLAERMRDQGVDLRLAVGLERFLADSDGHLRGLRLTDGSEIEAQVALVAVGVEPQGELLPPRPHTAVFSAGDVVGPGHWTAAFQDGAAAAHRLLGLTPPPPQPHYVWSDQFGMRLQLVGDPRQAASHELEGEGRSFVARYLDQGGRLVAALLANRPREVAALRLALAA